MKNLSLIAVTLIALALAGRALSAPPEHVEKIRKEYRGAAAPDHLMFAHELFSVRAAATSDRDFALRIVQQGMQFDSEKAAEGFLSRVVAAANELESAYNKVSDTLVCGPDAPRDKMALYQILDQVDDLHEIKAHNAYVKFISKLDNDQQDALTAWLEEDKEGYYYRTAEHKSSYERTGIDVVSHVDMLCAKRSPKMAQRQ